MLSVKKIESLGQAQTYYKHYIKDDYYQKKDVVGHWYGKGAATLGLAGEIKMDDWNNLLEGRDKNGQQIVSPGQKRIKNENGTVSFVSSHCPGTDLTFSAPKSFSMLALIPSEHQDRSLMDVFDKAIDNTLSFIEKNYSQYRLKRNEELKIVKTDNLVVGKYKHLTSRETENALPDPNMHTHAFTMNITERGDQFRGLNNTPFYQNKIFFGQIFRAELGALTLQKGYRIKGDENGFWEIEGVSRESIEVFSKRHQEIETKVLEADIDNAKTRAKAAIITRKAKDNDLDMKATRQSWISELEPFAKKGFEPKIGKTIQEKQQTSPVLKAVASLSEREVHWSKEKLMHQTLKGSAGLDITIADVEKDIEVQKLAGTLLELEKEKISGGKKEARDQQKQKWKVKLPKEEVLRRQKIDEIIMAQFRAITQQAEELRFTTAENILIEKSIVQNVQDRQNSLTGLDAADVQQKLDRKYNYLRPEQKNAVGKILTSNDGVFIVQGYAGSGKTTMLKATKELYEREGYNVSGMSFTGQAAEKLQRESGIPSSTLHSHLYQLDREEREGLSKLTPRQKMKQVWIVDEASMVGNKQMAELTQRAAEQDAKLVLVGDKSQMQAISAGSPFSVLQEKEVCEKAELKDFLRQKDQNLRAAVKESVIGDIKKSVEKLKDNTIEIEAKEKRQEAIVKEYTGRTKDDRDKTMILTGTNKDREQINAGIRRELQAKEELDKKEYAFKVSSNRGKESEKSFSKEDKVIFLKNDRTLGVTNGSTGEIDKINKRGDISIKTENGTKDFNVKKGYNHLDHGYALTNHKAQGQTIKTVLINHDSETSLTNRNSFYVSISRATDEVKIYTNDKEGLGKSVEKWEEKAIADDLKIGSENASSTKEIQKEIDDRVASLQNKDNPELAQLEKHGEELQETQKFEGKNMPGMSELESGAKDSGQEKEKELEQEMAM